MTTSATSKRTLTLGHSPDPDDAFMFYALAENKIDTRGWEFEHILQDIQTLNERAQREELDITAVSIHAYAYIADKYALLNSGASMGDNYGPMVVSKNPMSVDEIKKHRIAIPGTMTSAYLQLRLAVGEFDYGVVPFDEIIPAVASGEFAAGLIIHEGQLTYGNQGLHLVIDMGRWWKQRHNLPLPLGGNVVRRSLGSEAIEEISAVLKESIQYGLDHRKEAVNHSLKWARDMEAPVADQFVGMYVNPYTLDYGDDGRKAVKLLLTEAAENGIIPMVPDIEFV